VKDRNWAEQVQPADEFIKVLSQRYGAAKASAILEHASGCILCHQPTEYFCVLKRARTLPRQSRWFLCGLCLPCANLSDCVERIERIDLAHASASVN
jgi:hypothetical protein